jgi:hypothetical protein
MLFIIVLLLFLMITLIWRNFIGFDLQIVKQFHTKKYFLKVYTHRVVILNAFFSAVGSSALFLIFFIAIYINYIDTKISESYLSFFLGSVCGVFLAFKDPETEYNKTKEFTEKYKKYLTDIFFYEKGKFGTLKEIEESANNGQIDALLFLSEYELEVTGNREKSDLLIKKIIDSGQAELIFETAGQKINVAIKRYVDLLTSQVNKDGYIRSSLFSPFHFNEAEKKQARIAVAQLTPLAQGGHQEAILSIMKAAPFFVDNFGSPNEDFHKLLVSLPLVLDET